MSDIPSSASENVVQSPKTPRVVARRSLVHEDKLLLAVSADYSAADLVTTRAGATWGNPVDVRGWDEINLFIDLVVVASQTGVVIALQHGAGKSKADTNWYDRFGSFGLLHGDDVAIPTTPRDLTLDVSGFAAGAHRLVVPIRTVGNWMRFKPYGAGTVAASRATISALRASFGG